VSLLSGVKHLDADPLIACNFLAFTLGWECPGASLPVFVDGRRVPSFRLKCGPGMGEELWRAAHSLDLHANAQVEVGLPETATAPVLWAHVTGHEQLRRATRFKPPPAMVFRFGSSSDRLLVWGLRETTSWLGLEAHNDRIAYALHASRARCAPEKLRVPVPSTFVRVGRSRPAPVLLTRMELTDYTRSQVTAALRDAPSKTAWRERRSA
jgi:hypothetical protein